MRGGGCTVQQALTAEAAAAVKQAVSLARQRGNTQVTPLHVASAMLQAAAPPGLLRAACLRLHSHPLQCKALELCFNVALNRLPASGAASPLLGHVYYPPSLSNALVAAFKRAQAHQRRGAVDAEQQSSVLAVKIELEQLVVSILDDPSVSRVMREAGFSSVQVKANVEKEVSSVDGNNHCTTAAADAPRNLSPSAAASSSSPPAQQAKPLGEVREEDVSAILECLAARSKRRVMVVAESAATAEAAARAAVEKIKRGDAGQETGLRVSHVVSLSLSMFRDAPRDEAERRLAELRCVVNTTGCNNAGAVVLFVEDLRWTAEFWARRGEAGRRAASSCYRYCAVEHAVAEVRALACRGEGVWLVGYGTYQSYMRCRAGDPSLESLWGLHTLAVPTGSLALSLSCVDVDSAMTLNHQSSIKTTCLRSGNGSLSPACLSLLDAAGGPGQLMAVSTCCGDCSAAKSNRSIVPSSSTIPPWLQHCRDQELPHCNKWTTINISPSSSFSSYEQCCHLHQPYQPWLAAEPKHIRKPSYRIDVDGVDGVKILGANVKSHDSSASTGSVEVQCCSKFKELNAENLKVLCSALEQEVPWQKEIVPEIASTVLRCRSGMVKRRRDDGTKPVNAKEETCMLFLGGDRDGKVRVARELANLVFGSPKSFVSIDGNASSTVSSDSDEQRRTKRPRSEVSQGCLERLFEAVHDNPHRVILIEGVEQAPLRCQIGIKQAVQTGVVRSRGGDEASLGDAIVVLSCESLDSRSRACSPPTINKTCRDSSEDVGTSDPRQKEVSAAASASCFDLNMSVDDDYKVEESSFGDAGLLEAVDRSLFFRSPAEFPLINRV